MEHQHQVDLRGLCCAQPIIILTAQLKSIPSGEVLLALADKPSMSLDMPAYCNQTDHTLFITIPRTGCCGFGFARDRATSIRANPLRLGIAGCANTCYNASPKINS